MADASAPFRIQGETGEWEVVVGLEVHAQVVSNAKLFSGASTTFGAEPNTQVSLVDAAMPGIAASTRLTCVFGSAPKVVEAPEKSLALETTCAWTSRPTTTSHSPLSPWIRKSVIAARLCRAAAPP